MERKSPSGLLKNRYYSEVRLYRLCRYYIRAIFPSHSQESVNTRKVQTDPGTQAHDREHAVRVGSLMSAVRFAEWCALALWPSWTIDSVAYVSGTVLQPSHIFCLTFRDCKPKLFFCFCNFLFLLLLEDMFGQGTTPLPLHKLSRPVLDDVVTYRIFLDRYWKPPYALCLVQDDLSLICCFCLFFFLRTVHPVFQHQSPQIRLQRIKVFLACLFSPSSYVYSSVHIYLHLPLPLP